MFDDVRFPVKINYDPLGGPEFNTLVLVTGSGAEKRNANWSIARRTYRVSRDPMLLSNLHTLIAFYLARKGRLNCFRLKDWSDFRVRFVSAWAATTAYSVNNYIKSTNTTTNWWRFICVTAGTSGGSEPTWANAADGGDLITDGTVVWKNDGALRLGITSPATGDAVEDEFQMQAQYNGGAGDVDLRNITKPVSGTVTIKVAGVTKTETTQYTINYATGVITFTAGNIPAAGYAVTWDGQYDVCVRFETDLFQGRLVAANVAAVDAVEMVEIVRTTDE